MTRWFRSEHMEYISLIVNEDAAHDCLSDLGRLSAIQFTDLNPDLTPFQRRYVSFVRRCDELERKLRFFGTECDNFGLRLENAGDVESFLDAAAAGTTSALGGRTSSGLSAGGGKIASGTQLLESLEVELEGECGHNIFPSVSLLSLSPCFLRRALLPIPPPPSLGDWEIIPSTAAVGDRGRGFGAGGGESAKGKLHFVFRTVRLVPTAFPPPPLFILSSPLSPTLPPPLLPHL